jgi:hypothetical protein
MEATDMLFGYILGHAAASFFVSFIIIGLCYLIGWRKYPTWRARFWWVTFALAGILVVGNSIGQPTDQQIYMIIAGIIMFIIALMLKKNNNSSNQ